MFLSWKYYGVKCKIHCKTEAKRQDFEVISSLW